jgi:hypothetical protein
MYSTLTADAAAAHRRELHDAAQRDRLANRARAAARARRAARRSER